MRIMLNFLAVIHLSNSFASRSFFCFSFYIWGDDTNTYALQVQIRRLPKPVIAMVFSFSSHSVPVPSFSILLGSALFCTFYPKTRLQVMLLEGGIYCTWYVISQLQQIMLFLGRLVLR